MKKISFIFLLLFIIFYFTSCDPSTFSDVKNGTWMSHDGKIWIDFDCDSNSNQLSPDGYLIIANQKFFISLASHPGSQPTKYFYLLKYEDGIFQYVNEDVDLDNYVLKAEFSLDKTKQILILQVLENRTNDNYYEVDKIICLYPC